MNSSLLERNETTRRTWQDWVRDVFSFDLRSLALFRICVGLLLLADLIRRSQSFTDLYTEDGFVTRALSRDLFKWLSGEEIASVMWSLHWFSESTSFQIFLFLLAGLFAVLLTVGAWTRLATIASWILLVSLQARNPLVLTSGDFFLKMCLFWSMFLPLASVWSIDARKTSAKPNRYSNNQIASLATAGFMLQLIFMYFFTGLAKMNPIWISGDAMYYVLRLDIYLTEFGRRLVDQKGMLKLVSWATLFVEVVMIWTLLSSWQNAFFRWLNLLVYWAFHIGIALAMDIGLFPIICMVGWLPLIPHSFWGWCLKERGVEDRQRRLDQGRLTNLVCGVLIVYVLAWNVFNIESKTNEALRAKVGWNYAVTLGYFLRIDQHFQMFGDPPKTNPWFVYEAKLKNGTDVDLFQLTRVNHARPVSVRDSFPNHQWRKLHRNLVEPPYEKARQPLADFFVRKWNRTHPEPERVDKLRLICYLERIGPDYNKTDQISRVWGSYTDPNRSGSTIFDELDKLGDDPLFQF